MANDASGGEGGWDSLIEAGRQQVLLVTGNDAIDPGVVQIISIPVGERVHWSLLG